MLLNGLIYKNLSINDAYPKYFILLNLVYFDSKELVIRLVVVAAFISMCVNVLPLTTP